MWQFWIDVGGTFTDCIARAPDGTYHARKVLSSGRLKSTLVDGRLTLPDGLAGDSFVGWTIEPASGAPVRIDAVDGDGRITAPGSIADGPVELSCGQIAPIIAIRLTLRLRPDEPIPAIDLKLGTTRGTNALLERAGAKVGFLTTAGFGDALLIGTQQRPELFALDIVKHRPLYHAVAEVPERIAADGSVIHPLDESAAGAAIDRLIEDGCETIAVALVNSYLNDVHERRVGELARARGVDVVTESAALVRTIQFLPRAETAVLDAYLEPTLRSYVDSLEASLPGSRIRLMTSAGGLVEPAEFRGTASLLSGPAGGVVGCADAARSAGLFDDADAVDGAIGFDMGGTSTDVCRVDATAGIERVRDKVKAGVRVAAPTVAVETVAAGGGSICDFDGVKLTVGPASAGADPGPACYGRGGPLTVTDCNVLLGRVLPDQFPFPLDVDAARDRLHELKRRVAEASDNADLPTDDELINGLFRIATENMAQAVRRVTVASGHDPARDVMVTFGGAGGQYACAVAEELGCTRVLVHPYAGLLSAFGIGRASEQREMSRPVLRPLDDVDLQALMTEWPFTLAAEESTAYELDVRYVGTEATLSLMIGEDDTHASLRDRFDTEHRTRYGYVRDRTVEVVNARFIATNGGDTQPFSLNDPNWPLPPADVAEQPVTLVDPFSTTVIDPGWSAERLANGSLLLTRESVDAEANVVGPAAVQLELFHSRFGAIAEQMGVVLQNTSVSTNVKERLDYSCAVFDAEGHLVVNAPHIPVHLGAMGETVRHLIGSQTMRPGDVFVTNDPYRGGSHLPDVTVVTPVFVEADHSPVEKPSFFVASRAHHAEIGGTVPGSIPPNSTSLAEEGVLISDFRLVDAGVDQTDALAELITSGPYPTRNLADNLADIAAQSAANQTGIAMLRQLVERVGLDVVQSMMQAIREAAARKTEAALRAWSSDGQCKFTATDQLDDGSPIRVAVRVADGGATFDFSGTGSVVASNLNANRGIVTAAVLYTLRLLLGRVDETVASMPLNEGVLDPVEIVLPECLLNPTRHDDPEQCAAVVGGNTETSQRVVDVLMQALALAACSQGTMNNVTFGDGSFGYYETIAGGSGATSEAAGADAVQVHMTNTRMTDVEVVEHRYPIRVQRFAVRSDSGGAGKHRGGNGVIRELEFLAPLSLSLLTGRRESAPPGQAGGNAGQPGKNTLIRANGTVEALRWRQHREVAPGDRLRIETPGGGGYGDASENGA